MTFYKFKSLENIQHASDIIKNERLYCEDFDKLNDPFEGLFFLIIRSRGFSSAFSNDFTRGRVDKKCEKILEPFKICSLSKELSDVRMWSFYANDHKGIAIEIDFTGFEKDIKEVRYSDELPKYNPDPAEILTKKTNHWCYESEYRVIRKCKYYSIKGRIKTIYLGQRISKDHLGQLTKIIPSAIPIYKTKLDTTEIRIKRGHRIYTEELRSSF